MSESTKRSCLYGVYKRSYTTVFDLHFQSQTSSIGPVNDSGFSEIPDIGNVRNVTRIKSIACIQPKLRKVVQ